MRSVGALGAVALACFLVVAAGATLGASKPSSASRTFVLYGGDDGIQQQFELRAQTDEATISVVEEGLTDASGAAVGEHYWQCLQSSLAWYCSGVISVTSAATGVGTITLAGLFEGFNGELMAVTGGTGHYAGARGTVELTVVDGRFVRTVQLLP